MTTISRYTSIADLPEWLTPEEAMAWLDTGRSATYEAIRRGQLPCIRVGRLIRIPREELVAQKRGAA